MIYKRKLHHDGGNKSDRIKANLLVDSRSNFVFCKHLFSFWICLLSFFAAFHTYECCPDFSTSLDKAISGTVISTTAATSKMSQTFETNQSIYTATTKSPQNTLLSYSPSSNWATAVSPEAASSSQSNIEHSPKNPYSYRVDNHNQFSNSNNDYTRQQLSIAPQRQANDDYNFLETILETESYLKMLQPDDNYQRQTENSNKKKPDVSVTIYHHQGIHDPVADYGKGKPWNFLGNGYGLHYGYDLDGKYTRQKGYNFVKAHGREFCKQGQNCDDQNKATGQQKSKPPKKASTLENHIFSVMKNDNFDVNNFFGAKKNQEPEKESVEAGAKLKEDTDSIYSFATDKSSPVLTRPATMSHMRSYDNIYNAPSASMAANDKSISTALPAKAPNGIEPVQPLSNVYLKLPKANVTTFPLTIATTTTTKRPEDMVKFAFDEDRDFEAMISVARANQYGSRAHRNRPLVSSEPIKTMTTVWQSPVRTIYGQPSNYWGPLERPLYPTVVSSNVRIQPPNTPVSSYNLRPHQQVMSSDRDAKVVKVKHRVPNGINKPLGNGILPPTIRTHPVKHSNVAYRSPVLYRRLPVKSQNLKEPSNAPFLPRIKVVQNSRSYQQASLRPSRGQLNDCTRPRTPQTTNPYSP